jgi:hypothetical protein
MLTPNNGQHVVLLPQDKQIMTLTGMDETQYRWFCRQAILHSKLRPGEPTAFFDPVSILIQLVIGIALTYAASLLSPKPKQQAAGQPDVKEIQGQTLVNGARYTPKAGFDSVQNVVELGSTIPIAYANRQKISGTSYGGLRVNTNLLWSQIYSVGGGQLLRAVFLVGEANVEGIDPTQFAIGNNIISGYDLERRSAGRICLYYSQDGGRLVSSDYIAGVEPSEDVGNAQNSRDGNGNLDNENGDVFEVRGPGDTWTQNFCYTSKPSNQTKFGLYGFIGNNLPFRINPTFRPAVIAQTRSDGKLNCKGDGQQVSARKKQNYVFPGRTGLTVLNDNPVTGSQNLAVGDVVELNIYSTTDALRTFTNLNGEISCTDVGQSVSSRQRSIDEQVNYGELYRIGSAFGICISRTAEPFVSDADNDPVGNGTDVTAKFEIIRPGICDFYSGSDLQSSGGVTATEAAHVLSAAEANVSTERQGRIVEIGLRSQSQINISGLCSFKDGRGYQTIDDDACNNDVNQQAQNANLINFISGNYSTFETRYSFFRVAYRVAGTDNQWTNIDQLFGVRSTTGVAVYNYLRIEFSRPQRWDIRITPISGWEIRSNVQPGDLIVLDPHMDNRLSAYSASTVTSDAVTVQYTGEPVARSQDIFGIPSFDGSEVVGNGFGADDSTFMVDAWARLAEGFIYNEVEATTSQPEHELVYLNTITENTTGTPEYDNLAIVGMNIRSSKEISTLNQFSVYVNVGVKATSNFPEVLYDLLTNERYGAGKVMSPAQIDKDSFDEATTWAYNRRYFFDGAVSEKINLRSWGAATAQNFLLDLLMRNGKFALQPVANFYGPETFTGLFSSGNIIEDSFELSYVDEQDRIPPRISVIWREEREISAENSKGLFPVVREVTVREVDTPEDAPLEKIDLSDYCTSQQHAIDVAKWTCRTRRLVTHTVSFKTVPSEAALDLGAVFKLGMETVTYNQPGNGAVSDTGEVTSWPPLSDGTYPVLLWDGQASQLQEISLTIVNGKSTSYAGSVFCVRGTASNVQSYKTMMLSFDEDGNIEVEAIYFPTDAAGNSDLAANWDVDWVIEGVD